MRTHTPKITRGKHHLSERLHRIHGPSIIALGKYWFQRGQNHRLNGPAYIYPNGINFPWFLHGKRYR